MKITQPKILIVDDNKDIHSDFRKILASNNSQAALDAMSEALFGDAPAAAPAAYTLDDAFQGNEAVEKVQAAIASGERYGMAFVDVRMPPGMDGVQTIQALLKIDPTLECIICTAYSDYTPESARRKIGISDGLMFMSKPFDPAIVRQLAKSMAERHATVPAGR